MNKSKHYQNVIRSSQGDVFKLGRFSIRTKKKKKAFGQIFFQFKSRFAWALIFSSSQTNQNNSLILSLSLSLAHTHTAHKLFKDSHTRAQTLSFKTDPTDVMSLFLKTSGSSRLGFKSQAKYAWADGLEARS